MRMYESERTALHAIRVRRARVRLLGALGVAVNLACYALVKEMSLLIGIVALVAILSPDVLLSPRGE